MSEQLTERAALERYDQYLDDVYSPVEVAGIEFDASRILKELDPIAYRTGFNDWTDSEDIEIED